MLNDADRATDADWLPYRAREQFDLLELACLLQKCDPERVLYNVSVELQRRDTALHGRDFALEMLAPNARLGRIDALPEMTLGDQIGGTLKALKKAVGTPTMHTLVRLDEAQRLAAALGLSWPSELPRSPGVPEAPADTQSEAADQRQERRYQMCIDAGLTMPTNDYARLPRGIGALAKTEGITRQAFSEDLKAHLRRLAGN